MIRPERISALMQEKGLSQSELARRVGISQSAIHKLVKGGAYGSVHLHRVARELGTSAAYLSGEIDDPAEGAPPAPLAPTVQFVMMQVALPPEPALARMFEGLLRMMPADASLDERAQLLARRLPIGLSQLRDLLPIGAATATSPTAPAESPPTPVPAPQS